MSRPFVLASVAMSIDGYIDDLNLERLLLSNKEDFDRVDQVRSEMDAILVGAGTVRADNPRLIVKDPARRDARVARGESEHPVKITVTGSGQLGAELKFWHHGGEKIVYTTDTGISALTSNLGDYAEIVSLGTVIDFGALLDDLGSRGIRSLMVEGGESIHTAFLSEGLVDELHLTVAPVVVGDDAAPRFIRTTSYQRASMSRMELIEVRSIGDVVLLRYRPKVPHEAS